MTSAGRCFKCLGLVSVTKLKAKFEEERLLCKTVFGNKEDLRSERFANSKRN